MKNVLEKLVVNSQKAIDNGIYDITETLPKSEIDLEEGKKAAEACCLNIIAQLNKACNNNLDAVKSCIQLAGYVNSADNFIDQPKVINGASELMTKIFGDIGIHTRSAVSCNSLPLGASVEIVSIFEIS